MDDKRTVYVGTIADAPLNGPYGPAARRPQLVIACSNGDLWVTIFAETKIGTGLTDSYLVRLRYDGGQRYLEHWYGDEDVLEPKDRAAFIRRLVGTSRFLIEAQVVGTTAGQYMAFDTAGLANVIGVVAEEGCKVPALGSG